MKCPKCESEEIHALGGGTSSFFCANCAFTGAREDFGGIRPSILRSREEIERAHDIINRFLGEIMSNLEGESEETHEVAKSMRNNLGVLCWALNHNENNVFAANLESLTRVLEQMDKELASE